VRVRRPRGESFVVKRTDSALALNDDKRFSGKMYILQCRVSVLVYYCGSPKSAGFAKGIPIHYLKSKCHNFAVFQVLKNQDYECELVESMESCSMRELQLRLGEISK
jgi:hypothetical protein